jgi:hypothetical protein
VRRLLDRLKRDRLLAAACLVLNTLVFVNAYLHDPAVGYDAHQHAKYVLTLSEGRLPLRGDTGEFFSPPLPYLAPALLLRTLHLDLHEALKGAQVVNALLSLGITFVLLEICEEAAPGDPGLPIGAVLLLGLLTVYYKSMSFVRGEPYVAFLSLLCLLLALRSFASKGRRGVLSLGIALGLLLLSRQWGIFVVIAIVVFVVARPVPGGKRGGPALKLVGSLVVCGAIALPFYWHLAGSEGSPLSFNRPRAGSFSFSNEPDRFYRGLGEGKLFTDPVRPAFPNELVPIFYSEVWGDYWEFFLVYAKANGAFLSGRELAAPIPRPGVETNRATIAPYLGRVNAISLLPSLVLLGGLLNGLGPLLRLLRRAPLDRREAVLALLTLVVLVSMAGYFFFLVSYPETERGDTIKATYLLHVFPLSALLGSAFLSRFPRARGTCLALVVLVFLHNLPALITRSY